MLGGIIECARLFGSTIGGLSFVPFLAGTATWTSRQLSPPGVDSVSLYVCPNRNRGITDV